MIATTTTFNEIEELISHFDNFKAQNADTDFPHETFRIIRQEGLLALPLLAEYDPQQAASFHTACAAFYRLLALLKAVGRGSLPAGRIYEGHANALHLIQLYGIKY